MVDGEEKTVKELPENKFNGLAGMTSSRLPRLSTSRIQPQDSTASDGRHNFVVWLHYRVYGQQGVSQQVVTQAPQSGQSMTQQSLFIQTQKEVTQHANVSTSNYD